MATLAVCLAFKLSVYLTVCLSNQLLYVCPSVRLSVQTKRQADTRISGEKGTDGQRSKEKPADTKNRMKNFGDIQVAVKVRTKNALYYLGLLGQPGRFNGLKAFWSRAKASSHDCMSFKLF